MSLYDRAERLLDWVRNSCPCSECYSKSLGLVVAALKREREQAQKASLDIAAKFCLDTFDVAPMLELRRAFGVSRPESMRRKPKGAK